jgi:hypothetical protein
MEVFQPLADFVETIREDGRIGPTHISLYVVLLHRWNLGGGRNPFTITRAEAMKAAKISARGTYNKCMRELHGYRYITYTPSSRPGAGSRVSLNPL